MKIESVVFEHPKHQISNKEIVSLIRENSEGSFDGDLDSALNSVSYMLENIGLRNRYWMKDEKPLDLMVRACEKAFEESGLGPNDIDVMIFCGIARGFLEPADSYFIAQKLGMDSVDCFDVLDSCMAWSRSCDVVESFFRSGRYQSALIVNAESYFHEGGIAYPSNFTLNSFRSLEYDFGAFCGGDGAAATILTADDNHWERHYLSTKEGANLCTIPLEGFEGRCSDTDLIGLNGIGQFTSFSSRVFQSYQYMIDILKKISHHFHDIKGIYAHTGGDINAYEKWAEVAGAGGKIKYIFPEYGNIGTLSMPASIASDIKNGSLERGDKVGCWIGSTGMSFSSYVLTY